MVRERLKGIFMEAKTLRQIRGAKELAEETIDAAALAINEVQRAMTRLPYGLLARIRPLAVPVQVIEQAHLKIADSVTSRFGSEIVLSATWPGSCLIASMRMRKRKGANSNKNAALVGSPLDRAAD